MSQKIITSVFYGFILALIIDVIFFIGLKITYLGYYGIDEYFNAFFMQAQAFYFFIPIALAIGYLSFVSKYAKTFLVIYAVMFVFSFMTFVGPIGLAIGEMLFLQKNVQITDLSGKQYTYNIIYDGQRYIYFQPPTGGMILKVDKATAVPK